MENKFYPYGENVHLCNDWGKVLDKKRKDFFYVDKTILDEEHVVDIDSATSIPNGKNRIDYNKAHFECFFHEGDNKRLYVLLAGARTDGPKKREIPLFTRWSYYTYMNCYWLSIEDPMYYDNDDLLLGWFWGDNERNYRQYVADIVKKICVMYEIHSKDVVFFGSSGGGTAAIHMAALFGECVAVSLNGQLNFEYETENHKIRDFVKNTGIDITKPDMFDRNNLCKVMENAKNTKFLLLENCRSPWDFNDHLIYFCKKMNITPPIGLSKYKNIYLYIYDVNVSKISPHKVFENQALFLVIDDLTKKMIEGSEIEEYQQLYLVFSELWRELYLQKEKLKINAENFQTCKEENDISLVAETDNNFKIIQTYVLKEKQTLYYFSLEDIAMDEKIEKVTYGIYDCDQKKFIEFKESNAKKIQYTFVTGDTIRSKMQFRVYVGQRGKTGGKKMSIKKFTVKKAFVG